MVGKHRRIVLPVGKSQESYYRGLSKSVLTIIGEIVKACQQHRLTLKYSLLDPSGLVEDITVFLLTTVGIKL